MTTFHRRSALPRQSVPEDAERPDDGLGFCRGIRNGLAIMAVVFVGAVAAWAVLS